MVDIVPAHFLGFGCGENMAHITGEYVGFNVDPCPFFITAEEGFAHGDRDNGEAKSFPYNLIDRQTDPIDGDGAFRGDEGDKR